MSGKHTPGPWAAVYENGSWYVDPEQKSGPLCVAEVSHSLDTEEADARLMAAAPDLLEACRKAFDILCQTIPDENERVVLRSIHTAIRKATGEGP